MDAGEGRTKKDPEVCDLSDRTVNKGVHWNMEQLGMEVDGGFSPNILNIKYT